MEGMTISQENARQTSRARAFGLVFLDTLAVGVALIMPPLPLDPLYHDYIDQRVAWGIPNAGDVLSGLAILAAGLAGLVSLYEPRLRRQIRAVGNQWPFAVFFASAALASVGLVYYHLNPTTDALFWSRLPIAAAFMALLSIFVVDRVTQHAAQRLMVHVEDHFNVYLSDEQLSRSRTLANILAVLDETHLRRAS